MAQALSWCIFMDPQQDEEEGQHSLDLGSAGNKHARLLWAWMQQGQDVGVLQNCVSIHLPSALKTVIAGCFPSAAFVGWCPSWARVTSGSDREEGRDSLSSFYFGSFWQLSEF